MKHKTKQTLKTILLGALGIGAIVGVASGINTLVEKNDTELKTIHPTFSVGGLNEADGKYELSDKTLYTKDAFECQGLQIKLAFDNYIDYQVFFYEDDGDFISASSVISGNQEINVPLFATHARLELTPNWDEMGEDYAKEKDQVIKWYEVTKYTPQIEVKVNKEQLSIVEMIESNEHEITLVGQGNYGFSTGFTADPTSKYYYYNTGNIGSYDEIVLKVKTSSVGKDIQFNSSMTLKSILLYDNTNSQSHELKGDGTDGFELLFTDGDFSYLSYDISNIDEIVFGVTEADVDTFSVYIK